MTFREAYDKADAVISLSWAGLPLKHKWTDSEWKDINIITMAALEEFYTDDMRAVAISRLLYYLI